MSTPKSVTKIKKGENGSYVEFTSNVDATQYYLFELSRAALRDVGKFIARKFREEFYRNFNRKTGKSGRATRYKVYSSKNTKYPRVEIGLKGGSGSKVAWWAYLQEFGTHDGSVPKLGILSKVAHENYTTIREIEAQYLSGIESNPESLINEEDQEGDADEN